MSFTSPPRAGASCALAFGLCLASSAGAQPASTAAPSSEPSVTLPRPLATRVRGEDGARSQLFAEDGFVLAGGTPPVRRRAAIGLTTRAAAVPRPCGALAYSTEGATGYVLGGYARRRRRTSASSRTALRPRRRALADRVDMDNGAAGPPRRRTPRVDGRRAAPRRREFTCSGRGNRAPNVAGRQTQTHRLPRRTRTRTHAACRPGGSCGRLAADHEGKRVASGSTVRRLRLRAPVPPGSALSTPRRSGHRRTVSGPGSRGQWAIDRGAGRHPRLLRGRPHLASTAATHSTRTRRRRRSIERQARVPTSQCSPIR
jgi:hypothetical protein